MNLNKQIGLILLTYKGKALLMYNFENAIDDIKHEWSFIKGVRKSHETLIDAIYRIVEYEAGIKVFNIKKISDNYFFAELTDKNVNQITRKEGQLLDFFSLKDLENLQLEMNTKNFAREHSTLI